MVVLLLWSWMIVRYIPDAFGGRTTGSYWWNDGVMRKQGQEKFVLRPEQPEKWNWYYQMWKEWVKSVLWERTEFSCRNNRNKELCLAQFKFEIISRHPCKDIESIIV